MSAPLRIRPPALMGVAKDEELKPYLDRLLKLIPAEVLSVYLTGQALIPKEKILAACVWAIVSLFFVAVVKYYGTSDRARDVPPDRIHIAISMLAFVIWVYSLGGPFEQLGLHEAYLGSLLVMAFTFISPYLYRGQPDTIARKK